MAALRTKEYAEALFELTTGTDEKETGEVIQGFVTLLAKKGLLKHQDKIIAEYQKIYNKKNNIVEATVTLINRLSDTARTDLHNTLKKKYNATEVRIIEKIDERLLGGMKVKVGDEIYDASIKNSLNQLEIALLK